MKIAVCLYVKDEEHDLPEWIAHHAAVGFDSFLIYDNLSEDNTAAVARKWSERLDVRVHNFPDITPVSQMACYDECLRAYREEFDWIAFIDADEFIVCAPGVELREVLAGRPENGVALHWRIFGTSGLETRPPGSLISETFVHRAEDGWWVNRFVKTIVRPRNAVRATDAHHFEFTNGTFDAVVPNGRMAGSGGEESRDYSLCGSITISRDRAPSGTGRLSGHIAIPCGGMSRG